MGYTHSDPLPRLDAVCYYPNSAWTNMLLHAGSQFDAPIPLVTPEGIKPTCSGVGAGMCGTTQATR